MIPRGRKALKSRFEKTGVRAQNHHEILVLITGHSTLTHSRREIVVDAG